VALVVVNRASRLERSQRCLPVSSIGRSPTKVPTPTCCVCSAFMAQPQPGMAREIHGQWKEHQEPHIGPRRVRSVAGQRVIPTMKPISMRRCKNAKRSGTMKCIGYELLRAIGRARASKPAEPKPASVHTNGTEANTRKCLIRYRAGPSPESQHFGGHWGTANAACATLS